MNSGELTMERVKSDMPLEFQDISEDAFRQAQADFARERQNAAPNTMSSARRSQKRHTQYAFPKDTLPKAAALLKSGIKDKDVSDADLKNLSKTAGRDFMVCPAEDANIADVLESLNDKMDLSDKLFEIPSVSIALSDPDKLLTQDAARIYALVSISDYSATAPAVLLQDPALLLANTKTMEKFTDMAGKGCLNFSRGHVRMRRAPNKDGAIRLTVVAAMPRLFETPLPAHPLPNDERVIPSRLANVRPSASGKLLVMLGKKEVLATGVVAAVEATEEPDTVKREESFAIKNIVKDCLATEDSPKEYTAMTTAVIARLTRYALAPGICALVHIAGIEEGTLIVADVWQFSRDKHDLAIFQAEVDAAKTALETDIATDEERQPKRQRLSFDSTPI